MNRTWAVFLLSFLLWGLLCTLILSRSITITFFCGLLNPCLKNTIPEMDQFLFGMRSSVADHFSFYTQAMAGISAFLCPLGHVLPWKHFKKIWPDILEDWSLFSLIAACNGVLTEISHTLYQRPRPFVFLENPFFDHNPSHYTSFFSGHTSFTATAGLYVLFIAIKRQFFIPLQGFLFVFFQILTMMTGIFRIAAGRHFLTDVIAGAACGWLNCILIFYIYHKYILKKTHPFFLS